MKIKIKKAVSNVVVSVVLVSLVLVSIGIFYGVIKNVINNPQLSPENFCPDLQNQPPIKFEKVCYNSFSKDVEISVRRTEENTLINSLSFVVLSGKERDLWSCSCGNCEILNKGLKKYFLSYPDFNDDEKLMLAVNNCEIDEKVIREC